MKYYSLKKITKIKSQYKIIVGERSNGKTYSVLELIIKNYLSYGKQGAYLRRWDMDFKSKRGANLFAGFNIPKITGGLWDGVKFKSMQWYFYKYDDELKDEILDNKPFCYGFALSQMEHDKSTSYPDITTICFDEFLTRGVYLNDEFITFVNCLSTIIRLRTDVTVYMLGNTVNMSSIYFTEMGLKNMSKMEPGTIDVYNYSEDGTGLRVAVEYCNPMSLSGSKESNIYFAFSNPKLNMITGGAWELDIYPHAPTGLKNLKVLYTFFILFEEETLQGDVYRYDKNLITYIHRKTTPIRDKEVLIYSLENRPDKLYRIGFEKPRTKPETKITDMLKHKLFYYQDNEVGEILNNYIQYTTMVKH